MNCWCFLMSDQFISIAHMISPPWWVPSWIVSGRPVRKLIHYQGVCTTGCFFLTGPPWGPVQAFLGGSSLKHPWSISFFSSLCDIYQKILGKTVTVQCTTVSNNRKLERLVKFRKISKFGGPPPPSAHLGIQMSLLGQKSWVQGQK